MLRNFIGGAFFVLLVFFSSFFGCIFKMGPTLPLLFLKPKWFRWISDMLLRTWLPLPSGILEILFGMKLFISTENSSTELKNDRALIIMNHRTRLDWLYYWSVILRHGKLENEKIILKNELKHIPGAGWAMQAAMFIFLQRKWENDERYLHQVLHYLTDNNYPLQLLLFPEGTDYCSNTLAKSKAYAMKNNLPIFKNVLHPRLRGFTYTVQQLRQGNGIDAIHDVTVGYRGNLCEGEFDLLMGNFPKEVYFHIKRIPIQEIPESTEELEKWCALRWAEKEERLEAFYENGRLESSSGEEKSSPTQESSARWEMVFWIVYWLTFCLTIPVLLYLYVWIRWYALVVSVIYLMLSTFAGGLENLQIWRYSLSNKYSDHQNNYSTYSYLDHNTSGKPHAK